MMEDLSRPSLFRQALIAADRQLKIRLRSEKELRQKLSNRGYSETVIDAVIEHYRRGKLVDDHVFARQWIQCRLNRPFGWKRIINELRQKGIAEEIIDQQICMAHDHFDESAAAMSLAQKQLIKYRDLSVEKAKRRLSAYLERRGFQWDIITQILKKL
jgi:regulatory protein